MKISSRPSLLLLSVLAPALALASPPAKKPVKVAATKKVAAPKSAASGPVSLGNGIFMLGEEGSAPSQSAAFPAPLLSRAGVDVPQLNPIGRKMISFCRSYLGHKLGNGQCTELAVYGLAAAGGQMFPNYQWGNIVCGYDITNGQQTIFVGPVGKVAGTRTRANVQPGDIIQYENATFEYHFSGGFTRYSYPHHTAIIEQVSGGGRSFKVLEQNVNETQIVVESTVNLDQMTTGTARIWRPISAR
jgi:hypothetical protein